MPLADVVDSDSDPLLFLGAFLGIGAFVLVRASYPEIDLETLTLGALVILALAYMATSFLPSGASKDPDDGLESTEAERQLVNRLSEVDPRGLDAIAVEYEGVRQAIDDLILLWAEGEDLRTIGPDDVEEIVDVAESHGIEEALLRASSQKPADDLDQ